MNKSTLSHRIITIEIRGEHDVVQARQRARRITQSLGFDAQEQTRITTATSELARNVFQYAKKGTIEFAIAPFVKATQDEPALTITVKDQGAGITQLDSVLSGHYKSSSGMGVGINGTRRLVDSFEIQSSTQGTEIRIQKILPQRLQGNITQTLSGIVESLNRQEPATPLQEIHWQNQELLRAMDELRSSHLKLAETNDELAATNRELDETNRGVVALYTELDEKAADLKNANEVKTRFISYLSHEFRTPINSILGLSRLLLERADGELAPEQEKQVAFIRRAAQDVLEMANDLLDLGKVEAGKAEIRAKQFELLNHFASLRGLLRPLLHSAEVELIIEDPIDIPPLFTDEGKLGQILRNLVSNAIKFTEHGSVRLSVERQGDEMILLKITDTGIGIPPEGMDKLFEEYSQIESPLQSKHKGTGLGLSLVRKLTELLGGIVEVSSVLGQGSTFSVLLPIEYRARQEAALLPKILLAPEVLDPLREPVLIVEDNLRTRALYRKWLEHSRFQPFEAAGLADAHAILASLRPAAIILDIVIAGEKPLWPLLKRIKADPKLRQIPVIVATASDGEARAAGMGAEAFLRKPLLREKLLERIEALVPRARDEAVLIVDDDEVSRYLIRSTLEETRFRSIEASNGREGLAIARSEKPRIIFLDLNMPELGGLDVLRELKADPTTRAIPVIIRTSQQLSTQDRALILESACALLTKDEGDPDSRNAELRQAILLALGSPAGPALRTDLPRIAPAHDPSSTGIEGASAL